MTTLACRYGTYNFEVMPFELTKAPSTFQKMIESVFEGFQLTILHVNDLFIISKNMGEHVGHCKTVFERIKKANLKITVNTCSFFRLEVKLLGHVFKTAGMEVDKDKIKEIFGGSSSKKRTRAQEFSRSGQILS